MADTIITGNDDKSGGYATGTKIKIDVDYSGILPISYESLNDQFFYIIRVFGTTFVKFATSRSDAERGMGITFTGNYSGGEVTMNVYDTPEEILFRKYLDDFRVAGERILLNDPIEKSLDSEMTIVVDPKYTISKIKIAIMNIFKEYEFKMGIVVRIGDINKNISNIPGVLRVYITSPIEDLQLAVNEYYRVDGNLLAHVAVLSGKDAIYQVGE